MKQFLVPALLGLALVGCTSSEPQGIAAVPAPAAGMAMPAPATPSFTGDAAAPATAPAPTQTATTAAGFPPPPGCGPGPDGTGPTCAAAPRLEKCRTAGSVTTCDVAGDPAADSTRYTN